MNHEFAMRLDPIVARRFLELQRKADRVIAAKLYQHTSVDSGAHYYKVPTVLSKEWAENVLSLLQRTFGENSIHFHNFSAHYFGFEGGWESDFLDSLVIFNAAHEDYESGYLFERSLSSLVGKSA